MVKAFNARSPSAVLLHFLDEGLLPLANREGLSAHAVDVVETMIKRAIDSGAEGILLTCSAYSPAVPELQSRSPVPILSADDAMLRTALTLGTQIGVVATVEAAGPTTAQMLSDLAQQTGQAIKVEVRVTPAAFTALKGGDEARHDDLVRHEIEELVPHCDVIVLAQISMARAFPGPSPYGKPVLSSPTSSADAILARLHQTPSTAIHETRLSYRHT